MLGFTQPTYLIIVIPNLFRDLIRDGLQMLQTFIIYILL